MPSEIPPTDTGAASPASDLGDPARLSQHLVHNNVDTAIYTMDVNGRITSWNKGVEGVKGYAEDEFIGRNFAMAFTDEDRATGQPQREMDVAARDGEYRGEGWRRRKDGSLFWAEVHLSSVKDADSRLLGFIKVTRDMTRRKAAEDALAKQLEITRTITDTSTQALLMMDQRGICTFMNPAAEAMLGFSSEEIQQKPLHELIHYQHPDGAPYPMEECPIDRALPENFLVREHEDVFIRKNGEFFPVLVAASPIFDESGRPIATIVEVRDITDRKEAEMRLRDEAETIRTINRIGQTLVSELDHDRLVQALTDAATELTGAQFGAFFYNALGPAGESYILYTLSGVPRETFDQFPMPRNTDVFGPTFRNEGVVRSDDITKDPRYGNNPPYYGMPEGHLPVRSYLAVSVVSRTGEVVGGLFFGHPEPGVFTARHETIIEGIAAQAAIAMDNARLFREAENARHQAEEASRLKDEFLATLSHELRTPLNAILGWTHLLRTGPADPERQAKGLDVIERNTRAQTQIIEDLLDMSRIISGKIRLDVQRVHLAPIIKAAVESVRPAAEARGIHLQAVLDPIGGVVSGDPNRLQQIAWNLLTNAIKFTPKEGRVQVLLERVNSHVEVSVIDTGKGIAPEFLPHVFDRFRQEDSSSSRSHGGLGLGLAIVKQLVELHGGSVRAKSPGEGQGATFVVSLPVTPIHPEPPRHEDHERADRDPVSLSSVRLTLGGLRVLVVDDDPDARELVKEVLTGFGATVTAADSVGRALEILTRERPDVLVSDIEMPGEDGYSLIRRVRALSEAEGGRTPAVALTAYARTEDRTRALVAGYHMHIAKPVEPAELVATLESLARR